MISPRILSLPLLALAVAVLNFEMEGSAADPPTAVRLGVVKPLAAVAAKDAPAAAAVAELFGDVFEKQTGLDVEAESAATPEAVAARLADGKLDLALFQGFELAWLSARHPKLKPIIVATPAGGPARACLVVNDASAAKEPKELKGDCVVVPPGTKPHCLIYLERLRGGLPAGACGTAKADDRGREAVLDAVAGGTTPAAVVDAADLAAYERNKPGVGTQLRVLARSEPFPAAALVYHEGGLAPGVAKRIREGLLKANSTPDGKALLLVRRLKGFEEPPAESAADLAKFVKAYPPPPPPK